MNMSLRNSKALVLRSCVGLIVLVHFSFAAVPANQLLTSGHADEAIRSLEQQIQKAPTDAGSYNLICRAYFMIEDWDRAIANCERAAELDQQKSVYRLWLGRAYGEKASRVSFLSAAGMAKRVRSSFERAVELDPNSVEARTDLGEFYTEAPGIVGGGKDKARGQADALMAIDASRGHWLLARIAEKNKDAALAEREYRAAITASHSAARSWFDLANFFFYAHRLDEMEQAIRTLESSTVDHPESLMHAAGVLLRSNRDSLTAIRLLRRYLAAPVEEGPAFKAHDQLGQLLERQGDRKGAAEEYRAAIALSQHYTGARDDLKRLEH
jgi:tetratricopeptide (TPR) repeat protein